MNWQIVMAIVLGVMALLTLCLIGTTIELEILKNRERERWQKWADREKKRQHFNH